MEYFKISLRPRKMMKDPAYCEGLIWESFSILRKTGQVYDNFQVIAEKDGFAVYIIMPGADSLDYKYCSPETLESVKKLAAIFFLEIESLGTVVGCEDACTCESSLCYILATDVAMLESPVLCGNCEKPVPLCKLPGILDKEGQSQFLNWQDQYRALLQLDVANYAPAYTEKELRDPASRINKMGKKLCQALSNAKKLPVFYRLERQRGTMEVCPGCGRNWAETHDLGITTRFNLCAYCYLAVDAEG